VKEDASMKQDSLGIKEQTPTERSLKLELATFYFSNATTSAFDYGLMGSK
jgi:hypothetical protein